MTRDFKNAIFLLADGSFVNGFRRDKRKFIRHIDYLKQIGAKITHPQGKTYLDIANWCKKKNAARLNHDEMHERDPR
jgi:hypothetical protein